MFDFRRVDSRLIARHFREFSPPTRIWAITHIYNLNAMIPFRFHSNSSVSFVCLVRKYIVLRSIISINVPKQIFEFKQPKMLISKADEKKSTITKYYFGCRSHMWVECCQESKLSFFFSLYFSRSCSWILHMRAQLTIWREKEKKTYSHLGNCVCLSVMRWISRLHCSTLQNFITLRQYINIALNWLGFDFVHAHTFTHATQNNIIIKTKVLWVNFHYTNTQHNFKWQIEYNQIIEHGNYPFKPTREISPPSRGHRCEVE